MFILLALSMDSGNEKMVSIFVLSSSTRLYILKNQLSFLSSLSNHHNILLTLFYFFIKIYMGACFGNASKNSKPHKPDTPRPVSNTTPSTAVKDIKISSKVQEPDKVLKVSCKSPRFELSLRYRHEVPIYDLKDQISKLRPDIDISEYSIHKGQLEVLDPTATLKQLGIVPDDKLRLKRVKAIDIPVVEKEIIGAHNSNASIKSSNGKSHANENESSSKEERKSAKELWRTAMPSPQAKQLIKFNPFDVSSTTNNTHDQSLKERHFPQAQAGFQVKHIGSVVESDESNLGEKKGVESGRTNRRRPTDLFKDLQGPFSLIRDM
ncbi:unnamed protein product [Blepharisma stoltei]|uniref:Ubiquitin-like domain-containing protein n=1 Tax=Blepharisma stoltei TaxID=1481888 RepID=A0AAU9IDH6_9CILI|nr:unnamed protein product [Blepharisma stoltei]